MSDEPKFSVKSYYKGIFSRNMM